MGEVAGGCCITVKLVFVLLKLKPQTQPSPPLNLFPFLLPPVAASSMESVIALFRVFSEDSVVFGRVVLCNCF